MKPALRLLPYALNIVLAVLVGVLSWQHLAHGRVIASRAAAAHPTPTAIHSATAKTSSRASPISPAERRRSMIDRLRALGAPNDLLARVALLDFQHEWEARFDACHGATDRLQQVQLEMELSKDTAMKAALGEGGFREWDQKCMLWEAMSTAVDVTPTEASAIYGLKKALQQRQHEVEQARLNGKMDDAQINQAYDQAYAQYYTQLKDVLGEQRYNRSQQLDDAFVADNLRSQLANLHPSEDQVRQLVEIEKAARQSRLELDRQFQDDLTSPAYQEKLNAMTEAQNLEYARVLGDEGYQAYQKAQDPHYAQMKKYETHWGLDDAKVDYVYGAMKDYAQQVDDIKAGVHAQQVGGQTVDWNGTQQKLQQLADAVQQRLQTTLGPASFDALQRNRVLQFVRVERRPGGRQ